MKLAGGSLALFAGAALLAMAALVLVPAGGEDHSGIDRRTGSLLRTAGRVLDEARATGDARAALDSLTAYVEDHDAPQLEAAIPHLRAELTDPATAAAADQPLRPRLLEDLTYAELLPILRVLDDDAEVGAWTERFFADTNAPAGAAAGIDAAAARLAAAAARGAAGDPAYYVAVAASFHGAGRQRARMRWLLRARERFPDASELDLLLAQCYLAQGRQQEAFAVTSAALARNGDDLQLLRLRAKLATWQGLLDAEAATRERIVALQDDDAERLRLLEIYTAKGDTAAAHRHANALARRNAELAALRTAVEVALLAGEVDAALRDMALLAERSLDPIPWRERIAATAIDDLRFDLAIDELEALRRDTGNVAYDDNLEDLYRRRNRAEGVLAVLRRRHERQPADIELAEDLMHLLVGLGRRDEARAVMERAHAAAADPVTFLRQLPRMIHYRPDPESIASLEARARAAVAAPELDEASLPAVLASLGDIAHDSRFQAVIDAVTERFGGSRSVIDFRIGLVDRSHDPAKMAAAAAALASRHPNEVGFVRAWAERAAWAGSADAEIAARERLAELTPDDADNRLTLATLLADRGEHARALPHWRALAAAEQATAAAVAGFTVALFALGRADEALAFVRSRVEHSRGDVAGQLEAAALLFGAGHGDAAALYYEAVLAAAPDQPLALLRLGQIRTWGNDAAGALPLLRRRLQLGGADDPEVGVVEFFVAETLWALAREPEAAAHYRAAADHLAVDPTGEHAALVAKTMQRLGDLDGADARYRELVARFPTNLDLRLDYADLLLEMHRGAAAGVQIDAASAVQPDHRRVLRIRAQLALRQNDLGAARLALRTSLERHGPDAGVLAELASVAELDGDEAAGLDAYRRWLSLQQDNLDARAGERRAFDQVADLAGAAARWRRVGGDRTMFADFHAGIGLDDRTKISSLVGAGEWSGQSAAVGRVTESAARVGLALSHRFAGHNRAVVGGEVYPGAPGRQGSGFAGLHLRDAAAWNFELYGRLGELWTDPAAAVGLSGRRDGVEARGNLSLATRFWVGLDFGLWRASVRRPATGAAVADGIVEGALSFGVRWLRDGRTATADRFRWRHTPTGPFGPHLDGPRRGDPWQLATWVGVQTYRLTGRTELPALLPVGDRFDHAVAGARLDRELASGLGASAEGFVATELHGGGGAYGLELDLCWRPGPRLEASLGAGIGEALNRDSGRSNSVRFQVHARW